jgi:hypothetical protein
MPDDDTITDETPTSDGTTASPIQGLDRDLHLLKGAAKWTDQMSVRAKTHMRDHLDYEIREGIGA